MFPIPSYSRSRTSNRSVLKVRQQIKKKLFNVLRFVRFRCGESSLSCQLPDYGVRNENPSTLQSYDVLINN